MFSLRKTHAITLLFIGALIGSVALSDVSAQLGLSNTTASPSQTISSATWTTNFTSINNLALNRTGGVVTGPITWSGDNAHDLGASGASRPRDLFLGRNAAIGGTLAVTGATTLTSTLAVNSTSAAAIDVAGGGTFGSGNVALIDTTGKIPAISSTYFASLSGANLTGLLEANITDGSVFPRLAGTETITGTWTIANNVSFQGHNSASAAVNLAQITSSNEVIFGPTAAQILAGVGTGTSITSAGIINFATGSPVNTWTTISSTGTLSHGGALVLGGVISPSALSADVDNYNPTGLSTASLVRVVTSDINSRAINGIAGGTSGLTIRWCNVGTSGVNGNISFAGEAGTSTASNRIAVAQAIAVGTCVVTVYDATSSRWRPES